MEQSYRKRLFLAAYEDFREFWSAHRYWVTFVSLAVSPAVLLVVRSGVHSLLTGQNIIESAVLGISLSIMGNMMIALWTGAKSLDAGLHKEIQEKEATIHSLSEKPQRSAAEQHAYDTLKQALDVTKETGVIALRHLRYHEKLTFGTYGPELPPGLTGQQALWVYNHCLSVGIVNRTANFGHSENTYSLSPNPAMTKALDELLFA